MKSNHLQHFIYLSFGCFFLAFLLTLGHVQTTREALAERLAPSILRFHVLANSDSQEDQTVKLEIRSLILDYMQSRLDRRAGKKETITYLATHQSEIEQAANRYLKQKGFEYQASLQLTNCYFPTKVYGSLVFPCGYYDAARITLGNGQGRNWWCVLYPQFCFVDTACQPIPEETLQFLHRQLKEDDYLALKDNRPHVKISFLLLPSFHRTLPHGS